MKIYDENNNLLNENEIDYSKGVLLIKENIYTFHEYSEEEQEHASKQGQINSLKQHLASTDYAAIKYAEGMMAEEAYKEIKLQRQLWREAIAELEGRSEEDKALGIEEYVQLSPEEKANCELLDKIRVLKDELAKYDYIGVKIAMGVATKEDYAKEIAYTETVRSTINTLEAGLINNINNNTNA